MPELYAMKPAVVVFAPPLEGSEKAGRRNGDIPLVDKPGDVVSQFIRRTKHPAYFYVQ